MAVIRDVMPVFELLQPATNLAHLVRLGARLDDRRHEGREARLLPTRLLRQLGMKEVEPVERVRLVLDAAVHVRTALTASVALDRGARVNDLELVAVGDHLDSVARRHCDHGHERAGRLPAFSAAADVIVRRLR